MPDRRTRFEAAGRSQRSVPTTARLRDRPLRPSLCRPRPAGHTGNMSEQHWFRREVLSLPAYVPGKEGMGPDVVKLASNETPFSARTSAVGPSPAPQEQRSPSLLPGLLHNSLCVRKGPRLALDRRTHWHACRRGLSPRKCPGAVRQITLASAVVRNRMSRRR